MILKFLKGNLGWDEYARFLVPTIGIDDAILLSLFIDSDKISMNLMDFYNDLAISTSDTFSLSGVNVSAIYLYNGKYLNILGLGQNHDLLVPFSDQGYLSNATNIPNSTYEIRRVHHSSIKSDSDVKKSIREGLKQ